MLDKNFLTFFNGFNEIAVLLDHQLNVLFVSKGYQEFTELTFEEIIQGSRLSENLADHVKGLRKSHGKRAKTFTAEDYNLTLGLWIEYKVSSHPLGVFVLMSDITAKKEAELAKLEMAMLAAEDASREKTYFLANMSHEIRTPLGTILGFADMLKHDDLSEGQKAEYLDIVARSGERLTNLVDRILDLSKIDHGALEVEEEAVDVQKLLIEIHENLSPQAELKKISFRLCFDAPGLQRIKTDPIRLRQILTNVIGNALKFTSEGGVEVHLKSTPLKSGKHKVCFKVKDTGVGISEKEAAKIFLPFTQGDSSTTRKYQGSGLGLALSRQIARALGGNLYLKSSRKGEGSVFVAEIIAEPVLPKPHLHVTEESKVERTPVKKELINLEGTHILVADDSFENQTLFKVLLSRMGASVDLAENGAEALKKYDSSTYDVILMDMQMPELDGYEATKELRKRGVKTPVIALTANAMKHDRDKCLKCGCSEYISKPVDPQKLFSAIDRLRDHSQDHLRRPEKPAGA